jgi:uncharacterized protein
MKLIPLVLMSLSIATAAAAQTAAAEPPQIIVTGEGTVKATPDQAWVQIGAESRSKVSRDAQQRNAEVMAAVQQKIASFGIPKDAVKTIAIDLQMDFDYASGKQTPRGYVARNTIEVRVDDLAKLGDVLDAAAASGAATIHGLRFDVKSRDSLEKVALQNAVGNAMGKAQAMALGAQRTIDRVLKIEESPAGDSRPMPMARQMTMAAKDVTPVAAGEIEIAAQVRLTLAIK